MIPPAGLSVTPSLFGATAGQGVVWYTGQFYALFYLQSILKIEPRNSYGLPALIGDRKSRRDCPAGSPEAMRVALENRASFRSKKEAEAAGHKI